MSHVHSAGGEIDDRTGVITLAREDLACGDARSHGWQHVVGREGVDQCESYIGRRARIIGDEHHFIANEFDDSAPASDDDLRGG